MTFDKTKTRPCLHAHRFATSCLLAGTWLLLAGELPASVAPPPAKNVLRSELFEFGSDDLMEDAGSFEINSATRPRFSRTEHFEVIRHADGGRTITTVTLGKADDYRIEGRFRYTPDDTAGEVRGLGVYEGEPVVIEANGGTPGATIVFERGGERMSHSAECAEGCLIDLAPSALPMFTMTRRYDMEAGGPQAFRWIGRSLLMDQVLLDGVANIEFMGSERFAPRDTVVEHYAFSERIRNEETGLYLDVAYNLYVDEDKRPLAFVVGRTVGERVGYEGITDEIPPRFPTKE
jgi:hypothetical protein